MAQPQQPHSFPNNLLEFQDLIDWRAEAAAVIDDVRDHVRDIRISDATGPAYEDNARTHIYLNVTTLEDRQLCVRLCGRGFRVVGQAYDSVQSDDDHNDEAVAGAAKEMTYDTPYALLGAMSRGYTQSFGEVLSGALQKLAETRAREEMEEKEQL